MLTNNMDELQSEEHYTLIKLGNLHLMLLQEAVKTLESTTDIVFDIPPPPQGVGWMDFQGQSWPVYHLTETLELDPNLNALERICVLLVLEQGFLGLVCHEVILQKPALIHPHMLPVCMDAVNTPITALVNIENTMACLTSPQHLADFIAFKGGMLQSGSPIGQEYHG